MFNTPRDDFARKLLNEVKGSPFIKLFTELLKRKAIDKKQFKKSLEHDLESIIGITNTIDVSKIKDLPIGPSGGMSQLLGLDLEEQLNLWIHRILKIKEIDATGIIVDPSKIKTVKKPSGIKKDIITKINVFFKRK